MKELLHRFIDECWDEWYERQLTTPEAPNENITQNRPSADTPEAVIDNQTETQAEAPAEERKLPEGKRVVRTKSTGDKVYFLDDTVNPKTKQWVQSPEALKGLGFDFPDVVEISDSELQTYKLQPTISGPSGSAPRPAPAVVTPIPRLVGGAEKAPSGPDQPKQA